ncbi:Serine/threonine-protein kinase env7 [Tilletia horrida]|uniref:non-specific serine/threonine protein kinase n=1 Tax=Tilletia horrida TaxID=155126 RepID=A0AAN6GC09_9BASI|nr:Serine/threonine-protein kinase env7 [Tilletia horrida]KAK0533197.1 Serine/threonine-protein kinase env7 [Tilletia horrida]
MPGDYSGVGGGSFAPSGFLGTVFDKVQDAAFALASCLPCNASSPSLKLNGRSFKIIKLLGEGGFSFVYLAQDADSGRTFALKKIRCNYGSEGFAEAMKEVEATKRFRSPNIIRVYDSAVIQEGEGKVIYIFLPYFQRGNVQDAINAHVVRGSSFSEREILELFLGTCKAVKCMHQYRLPTTHIDSSARTAPEMTPSNSAGPSVSSGAGGGSNAEFVIDEHHHADGSAEGERLIGEHADDDDGPGGSAYPPRPSRSTAAAPGATIVRPSLEPDRVEVGRSGDIIPYSHRDIKPANVMISDEGYPVLMDFGSTIKARVPIRSRREAIAHQDMAAERSSMPYRAPELFDVKTDTTLTESVDIWSLGCTLYAMAYLHSPFETAQTVEQGGSLALAVLNGAFKFPADDSRYSEGLKNIVRACLQLKPEDRPDIDRLIEMVQTALQAV